MLLNTAGFAKGRRVSLCGNSDYTNSTVYGAIYKFELSTGLITYIHTINDALDAVIGKNGYIKHPNNRLYGYRSYAYIVSRQQTAHFFQLIR